MKQGYRLVVTIVMLLGVVLGVTRAQAQTPLGTVFTYQGELQDGGNPADGTYDFRFGLYDAASGGSQIGTTITKEDESVTDGRFTVELDFGNAAFTGDARWLEIQVKPGTGGSFTTLTPRQPLTPTPYAIHAATAQLRVDDTCAFGSAIRAINADGTVECQSDAPLHRNQPPTEVLTTTVDAFGWAGTDTSVTIGADGLPIIAYHDGINNDLKAAHCEDITCATATSTTLDSAGDVGDELYIAIGVDGLPLISYYDAANGDLKVAHCDDVACTSATLSTIDTAGDVGDYTSITISALGRGLISYYDATNGALKAAHCDDLACTTATTHTVDDSGTDDVGLYTSIAVGPSGFPLISYYDSTNDDLKAAYCTNTACSSALSTTLRSSGDVGWYTDITIGHDALPIIAFWDSANELWVAHCDDPTCSTAAFNKISDTGNAASDSISITVGPDGLPMISYQRADFGALFVARCSDYACDTVRTAVVDDSTSNIGLQTSITIGADGLPLITYQDYVNKVLHAAHCPNVFCASYFRRR
jgi:hypothetical protein